MIKQIRDAFLLLFTLLHNKAPNQWCGKASTFSLYAKICPITRLYSPSPIKNHFLHSGRLVGRTPADNRTPKIILIESITLHLTKQKGGKQNRLPRPPVLGWANKPVTKTAQYATGADLQSTLHGVVHIPRFNPFNYRAIE